MSFGIMGVSEEFVPFFYGMGYEKCSIIFQILMPSCLFLAFANVIRTQHLIPHQRDKEYIISVFIGALVNFTINLLLIPNLGACGAAIGTTIAELSVCLTQCLMVRKSLDILSYVIKTIPFIFSGLVMYVLLISFSMVSISYPIALIAKIVIGTFIYFIALFVVEFVYKLVAKRYYCDLIYFMKSFLSRKVR